MATGRFSNDANLPERFLQYLHEEESILLEDIRKGDKKAVEDRKRLRQIRREMETIRGGAI